MGRAFILGLFMLLQASPPGPRQTVQEGGQKSKANQSKRAENKAAAKEAQAVPKTTQPEVSQPDATSHADKKEKEPITVKVLPVDVQKDRFDYIYIIASLVLTIATLVLAGTALMQAKAAKASAEAIVNSERAWIMVDIAWEHLGSHAYEITSSNKPERTRIAVAIICKNLGKTPGWITARRICLASAGTGESVLPLR